MMSKYSHSQKCHLLHAFEHLRDYPPEYPFIGVCGNLEETLRKLYPEASTYASAYDFIADIVEDWPETYLSINSEIRDIEYPIGGPAEYSRSNYEESMFDKSTEHGLKRYRLIDYSIQELKNDLGC
jgi:hypothetical protein